MRIFGSTRLSLATLLLVLSTVPQPAHAYSVLTHEQIIDLTWADSIRPLLLRRYPNLTPAQLREARAYAYGGCVIQDLGYYPLGKPLFSDLLHYVRTGDFIRALFRDAKSQTMLPSPLARSRTTWATPSATQRRSTWRLAPSSPRWP